MKCSYFTPCTGEWYQRSRSLRMKMKKSFLHTFLWKVNWFTSDRHENDHQPIQHVIKYISPAETHNFCDIYLIFENHFCNYFKNGISFQSNLAYVQ